MDLESTIEDAVNDSVSTEPEVVEPVETSTEVETSSDTTDVVAETESTQAPAPGQADAPVEDEFAKRFGLQGQSITGRENRIPYSRVKKIVERAEKEALAKAQKATGVEFQPKLAEAETKIRDYEGRLQKVAEFENLIEHQPEQFLNFLSTLPAYKEFFSYIQQLAAGQGTQTAKQDASLDLSDMPQPDQPLPDGTKVYSMEGLQKLLTWQAQQVEARAIRATEERLTQRYKPIEDQWQAEQRRQAAIPVIQRQIAEARTWPGFTDNEAAIVEALKADQNLTIEGAYRKVVVPKLQEQLTTLQPDRDRMRQEIIAELRQRPTSTSAPTSQTRPGPQKQGPKSLEDIIREQVETLKK